MMCLFKTNSTFRYSKTLSIYPVPYKLIIIAVVGYTLLFSSIY